MSVIDFFSQPGWQRLGFALLHFLWQGALLALVTAGLVGLFRLRRGVARYRAYLLGFAVMAICPVATYLWLETPRADIAETTEANEAPAFAPPVETVRLEPPASEPFEATASRERAETTHASDAAPVASDPNPRTVMVQDLRGKIVELGRQAVPWSLAAWLVGVVVLGSRMLLGVVGSYRWRRGLLPLPDKLHRRAAALGERFGAAANRIWLSPSAVQPLVVGYLRPLVLLPVSLAAGMSPDLLEAVIAHELAHVRWFDPLVNLLQRIVETLLFYHPALWWLSSRVRVEREICCDEMAVQHAGDPVVYATALERAGRMRLATAQPTPALGLLNGRRPLLARIRLILGTGQAKRKPASSWPAGLLAMGMVVAVAAAIEFASPVEAASVEGKRLFGTVVDDKGEPVPRVEVSVVTVDEHPLRQALRIWVRTDQQGRFDVTAPLAGVKYYVMAEGRGGRIPKFMPGTGEEIILTLEARESRELSGIVRAGSGEPVAGATVALVREDSSRTEARTDDQGRYRIDVAGRLGQSIMHAETAELISPYQMVRNPDQSIDFTLGPPAELKGVVKDQLTGKSIGGCTITLKPPFSCGFARGATTDDAGRFSLVHVPPGEYEAGAASDTHYEPPTRGAFLERPEFPLSAGQSSFREITIRPMATVVGRVLRHDGQPEAGALAGMQAFWDMDRKHQYQRAQADAEGRFLIRTGRLNETLKVVSERGGFAQIKLTGAIDGETLDLGDIRLSGTIQIRGTVCDPDGKPITGVIVRCEAGPGGSGRVDVVLPVPNCVIRGRMVDANGNPASGARVDIDGKGNSGFEFGKHATPKADGGFEFKVPAGVYRLTIVPLDPGSWRKTRPEAEATVAEGETADEVVLAIRKAGWGNLIVEVVDKGGRPMPGVTVRSGGFGSVGNAPTAETDVAGRFLFKSVNAGKHYIILTDPKRMLNENMRLRIPIEAGKTVTRRIVLDGGRRVRGRVTCAGQPVNNVHVKTSIELQKRYSSCHTSEDGVFQLLLVPDGKLTIGCFSYMSNQTVTKSFDIAGDHRDDIEIELPTGRITGKILDRHGRLLKGRYIKLEQLQAYGDIPKAPYASTHHCENGLINLPHLGDGQYRLTLKDDYSSSSTADILAISDPIEIRNGKPVEDFVIREQ